jgi:hypothetical protein
MRYIINNVTVFDGTETPSVPATVIVKGERIEQILAAGARPNPLDFTQIFIRNAVNAGRQFSEDATITKGYKGLQVVPAAEGTPAQIIGAEKPLAYEVGAKGSALEGRLGYDLGVFYTKVQDYQGKRCVINTAGVLTCVGESIPSITTKGIELETFGRAPWRASC